jgi:diacylglycerol kinase family enzyme
MAVRVRDMGGMFRGLASRQASISSPHLHLVMVRPPAWLSMPAWFVTGWLGMMRWNPWVSSLEVTEFSCDGASGNAVHCEADGEWLGRIPMRVSMVADGVKMLLPE